MSYFNLPPDLYSAIGSERRDFAVKAKRAQPLKQSLGMIIFGLLWTSFTSVFVFVLLVPLFRGEEVRFESNGLPATASLENLEPILVPGGIIALFLLIGIVLIFAGFYSAFRSGGYFVGTSNRLIHFQNGKIKSMDWEQFSGNIEVSGDMEWGSIALQMRTGRMIRTKNSPSRYVPDVIYITGIPNVQEVERVCRKRIKENDPTPPGLQNNNI